MHNENLIQATNIKKYFSNENFWGKKVTPIKAVDGVSLEIRKGETFGLVGESGCGKSTLERTLVRMYDLTDGHLFYKGQEITNLQGKELRKIQEEIQIIFQDPYSALNPYWTAKQIILEPMEQKGISKIECMERAEDILEKVGMHKSDLEKMPYEFSGGQRQRLGIARALTVAPELILCDEPIAALDVSVQAQVVNLLADLKQELGLTYLFAAHDLSMVKYISDRIGVMYLGTMVEISESNHLYRQPAHPYTRALLSAIPIADPRKAHMNQQVKLIGEIPDSIEQIEGCRFASRCPYSSKRCKETMPSMREIEKDHFVACFLYENK